MHESSDHRSGAVPRHPFGFGVRTGLARPAGRPTWRSGLERPVHGRLADRLRAARLRLRCGAASAGRALHTADCHAPHCAAADAAGVPAVVRGLPAGAHQDGCETPDAGRHQTLGAVAPAGQRHARRRAAVRWFPGLGRGRPHLAEAPRGAARARRAGRPGQRPDCRVRRPGALCRLPVLGPPLADRRGAMRSWRNVARRPGRGFTR